MEFEVAEQAVVPVPHVRPLAGTEDLSVVDGPLRVALQRCRPQRFRVDAAAGQVASPLWWVREGVGETGPVFELLVRSNVLPVSRFVRHRRARGRQIQKRGLDHRRYTIRGPSSLWRLQTSRASQFRSPSRNRLRSRPASLKSGTKPSSSCGRHPGHRLHARLRRHRPRRGCRLGRTRTDGREQEPPRQRLASDTRCSTAQYRSVARA